MLIEAVKLFRKGEYQASLEIISNLKNTNGDEKLLELQITERLGDFEKFHLNAKKLYEESDIAHDPVLAIGAFALLLKSLWRLAKFKDAIDLIEKQEINPESIIVHDQERKNQWLSEYYNAIGVVYQDAGELDKGLQFLKIALDYSEKLDDKFLLGLISLNMGSNLDYMGRPEEALGYYADSLRILEGLDISPLYISGALHNLGVLNRQVSNFDAALEYYEKSLELSRKSGGLDIEAHTLIAMGNTFYEQADLQKALDYYDQAYDILNQIDSKYLMAHTLVNLITILTISGNTKETAPLIEKFENLANEEGSPRFKYFSDVVKTIYLLQSKRGKDRFDAQHTLEQLVYGEIVDFDLHAQMSVSLLYSLIEEFQLYENRELLTQINSLLKHLQDIATKYESPRWVVESLILKAKLTLIDKVDFELAIAILQEAYELASERQLEMLCNKIDEEKEQLKKNIQKWDLLAKQGISILERFKETDIQNFIKLLFN